MPAHTLTLTLPWPPSNNTYFRNVGGKVLISARGRQYRKQVANVVFIQRARHMAGRFAVLMDAYPPDRRARDLDNLPKAVLDSITHAGIWQDDALVDDLRIRRMDVVKGGRFVVRITVLEDLP